MKRTITIILSALLLLSATACGEKSAGKDSKRVVTINYAQSFPSGPMLVMKTQGYLEKNMPDDVEINWTGLTAATEMRDAIVSGAADIADFALSAAIIGIEQGLPLEILSYASPAPCNLYTNMEEISSLKDLPSDAQITVNAFSSTLHLAFLAKEKQETGSMDTYSNNLVPTPNLEAAAALANGSVDASILSFPTMLKTNEMENVRMLSDFQDVILEYSIGSGYITNTQFAEENPDIIEGFLSAQQEALELFRTDPDKFAQIMADEYGVDKDTVYEELMIYHPSCVIEGYDKQAQLLYEAKILEKEPKKFTELPNYEDLAQLRD